VLEARMRGKLSGVTFATGRDDGAEQTNSYDAIFCLAVLCLGDLTTSGAQRCDPRLSFDDFERLVDGLCPA